MIYIKIAVIGGIFWDVFIYGEQAHSAEILEMCGGSGLNLAFGLRKMGFDVSFFSNIGNDYKANLIMTELKKYDFDTQFIRQRSGDTGFHIALNEKPVAVNRGVNKLPVQIDEEHIKHCDCVVINTEVPKESIYKFMELSKEKKIFLDIGPIANLSKDVKGMARNLLVIGNAQEAEKINCDVIKLGHRGAKWGDILIEGDGIEYQYKIGSGDVFDVVLIWSLLNGADRLQALKNAVQKAQFAARSIKGAFSKMQ
ncbi:MAG: carbohydrate kinase family protein, partial [Pseudothermotoga sp.]